MTPYHLEVLLFLPMNKDLWTAADLQAILDHEDVEKVEDSKDDAAVQDNSDSDISSNVEDAVL